MLETNQDNQQKKGAPVSDEIEKLVVLAQKGDLDAFAKLYDFYVQKIYRYVFYRSDKAEALDLTETVFLKTWENLRAYRKKEGSSFTSWIFRIAHNLVVDQHRFGQDTVTIDETLADHKRESNPLVMTEQALSQVGVRSALSKLKKNYQEVLTLHYLNDLDPREVSRIMKKSEGSLRVLKFRALQELKKVLEEMGLKY
jgi:RNA polymerase sigma-70 factor, ECF subfamily